jgi:hypothetical protein
MLPVTRSPQAIGRAPSAAAPQVGAGGPFEAPSKRSATESSVKL